MYAMLHVKPGSLETLAGGGLGSTATETVKWGSRRENPTSSYLRWRPRETWRLRQEHSARKLCTKGDARKLSK